MNRICDKNQFLCMTSHLDAMIDVGLKRPFTILYLFGKSLSHSFVRSFVRSFIHSFIHSAVGWLVHSFVRAFLPSFIEFFNQSSITTITPEFNFSYLIPNVLYYELMFYLFYTYKSIFSRET